MSPDMSDNMTGSISCLAWSGAVCVSVPPNNHGGDCKDINPIPTQWARLTLNTANDC